MIDHFTIARALMCLWVNDMTSARFLVDAQQHDSIGSGRDNVYPIACRVVLADKARALIEHDHILRGAA